MASFGEAEVSSNSFIIGKVRVLGFHAAQAIYPRLSLVIGFALHDFSGEVNIPEELQTPYELIDISGELRLKEMQEIVGAVAWAGPRRTIRCSKRGHEDQVYLSCDLDFQRIEQIERSRAGRPPEFWLQLWPVIATEGKRFSNSEIRAFKVTITREAWLDFYAKVGGGQFDVIEVQFSSKEAEQFRLAVGQVRKAREQIANGDYDPAVEICRKAIEAVVRELPSSDYSQQSANDAADSPIKRFLASRTDERRGAAYIGILAKLKELMNIAVHGLGTKMIYSRSEAQFIVRTDGITSRDAWSTIERVVAVGDAVYMEETPMPMKIRVVIEANFETRDEMAARTTIMRIPGDLAVAIERGKLGNAMTGVTAGSVRVNIREQQIP